MPNRLAAPTGNRIFEPSNRLLAVLPAEDLLSLQPHLEAVTLTRGSILFDVDDPLTRIYFIETGAASLLTALKNRVTAGVAIVGREGAIGVATLLLGGESSLGRFQVLISGSALTVKVSLLQTALRESPRLRAACEAYTQTLFVQMLQAVPCNRLHTVEQRCARWLLMCADLTEDNTSELRQKWLAEILGVPLSKLTSVAYELQQAGLIYYRRGAITVANHRGLEAVACDCYRIVRNRNDRLLRRVTG
jgi:CRP-like cAMP-binding protein